MKEQNNIEGTVDKTSLKCKGVWIFRDFLSSVMFPLWHLSHQSTCHPSPLKPFHQHLSESSPPCFVFFSPPFPSPPSPPPLGHIYNYSQTHLCFTHSCSSTIRQTKLFLKHARFHQNEKEFIGSDIFLSFSSSLLFKTGISGITFFSVQ